ncbi:unnamed protein product [Rhodiola kirilowii]
MFGEFAADESHALPSVVYKVGGYIRSVELVDLWNEFKSSLADQNLATSQNGPTLEIKIPAEHVITTNRRVRVTQLWGTDIYTGDSDLVAVLIHTGYCLPTASPPPDILELHATIRVLPPQECYVSTSRNNIRSRSWGPSSDCSYRVEKCCAVKREGGSIDLEPCLAHSTVEGTLAPAAVPEVIMYNLCNEPWLKYSLSVVADKGLKKSLYTSARLKMGEVLYGETHSKRYELCFSREKAVKTTLAPPPQLHGEAVSSQNHNKGERSHMDIDSDSIIIDTFRWSRCWRPLPQSLMLSVGIPLPSEHVEVIEDNLDWEDIKWSQSGVWIAGKEYPLVRVHFLSPH